MQEMDQTLGDMHFVLGYCDIIIELILFIYNFQTRHWME